MSSGAGAAAGEGEVDGERAASRLPATVHARFPGYAEGELLDPAHRDFLVARLMEEGDGSELRWLVRAFGRDALASVIERRGGRAQSRRSRAFWERVLGTRSSPPHALAHELWPLA